MPWKTISPESPASLTVGQEVRVKFSSRWYDAVVVNPWEKQRKGKLFSLFASAWPV